MIDIEKLMKGLECCQISMDDENPFAKCEVCPYNHYGISVQDCRSVLSGNCIEVLKQHKKGHWEILTMCANEGIYCSECHMKIFDFTHKPKDKLSKYCPHCGSKNEQFVRDGEIVFR